jgi:hypothetical protein
MTDTADLGRVLAACAGCGRRANTQRRTPHETHRNETHRMKLTARELNRSTLARQLLLRR